MQTIGLDIQRKIKFIPYINMAILFIYLYNAFLCKPPVTLQLKTFGVIFGGILLAVPFYWLFSLVPMLAFFGLLLSYLLPLLGGIWLIKMQEEMGVDE